MCGESRTHGVRAGEKLAITSKAYLLLLDTQILEDAIEHAYELVNQQRQTEQEEWQNVFHLGSWEMK